MRGELGVPRIRAASAALVTLAAIAASVTMGSAATAGSSRHIPREPGAPAWVHYLPSHPSAQPNHTASNLLYHGGPVMQKMSNTYAIFWEPNKLQNGDPAFVAQGYNAGIIRYFKDVGGQGLYNINTQYYQVVGGQQQNIKNVSTFAGSWVDTQSYPASGCNDPATPGNCLSDAQIRAEVTHAQQVNGWSGSPTNGFFVFTSGGEGSCFGSGGSCAFTTYCGYHGFFSGTMYANMPYGATHTAAPRLRIFCTRTGLFPNQRDLDMETNILSHEHIEMVTDPALNAWYDSSGQEIGDLCVYNYGTRDEDNGKANQDWNGHFYLLQQEWDNHISGCAQDGP
jgi:hypothetical protein